MALHIKHTPGVALHHRIVSQHVGARIAASLVADGRSFMADPRPRDRVAIYVHDEHITAVDNLIAAFSATVYRD